MTTGSWIGKKIKKNKYARISESEKMKPKHTQQYELCERSYDTGALCVYGINNNSHGDDGDDSQPPIVDEFHFRRALNQYAYSINTAESPEVLMNETKEKKNNNNETELNNL